MSVTLVSELVADNLLRRTKHLAPFEGYVAPEGLSATPVPVGTFSKGGAQRCVLVESLTTEHIFSAFVLDALGAVRCVLDVPAQGAYPVLLADLCEAFAAGDAQLDPPAELGRMRKEQSLLAPPAVKGQDVDVYRSVEDPRWTLAAARPRMGLQGAMFEGVNVYAKDDALARRLALALQRGILSSRKLPGEYLA